ncbi:hypothetical protein F8568_030640 [Actinomadura sp. LD22]|uniref:Apolipoprotein N-acyltransferase N-terminal domain-containing protein n=1 Tax=Actinomadura physcomitrii TaxID=2650748 RepID=A0A6I4MQV9_9ACTN|nr:hypothetical protein [Actinomadura physcomitrii]MWA04656.1 hypothetical protein [Actinomadura physcomitrii]
MAAPHGAWLSLAYTQADVPPVVQLASLTGPWGITFLVMGVPAALAAAGAPGAAGRFARLCALLVAGPSAASLMYRRRTADATADPVAA